MFLDALEQQNPSLIEATLALFEQGKLLPDTTVIDVDKLITNAQSMKKTADEHGIRLYAMTKQIGRNPYIAKLLVEECGYEGIVCVDFKEARVMAKHGLPIANIGHLVQPPVNMIQSIVSDIKPQVMTVYSLEKAQQISDAAVKVGRKQALLLKFYHSRDTLYVNQESGFDIQRLDEVTQAIQAMKGVYIDGVTHFPCFLFDAKSGTTQPTPNLTTLLEAKRGLNALGIPCHQVNAPSSTNSATIPMLAEFGCTHGEPGHGLTGTTPANAITAQTERMAMLYLSEISHHYLDDSYCFGGGFYRRGLLESANVYHDGACRRVSVFNDETDSIDYHLRIPDHYPIGAPIIMAYRTQVFVTRSDVALIRGVSSGNPQIVSIYDPLGNEVQHV
ncbi:YhfX family PLP-dependent enzyme [uncultured Vibrio sp.]|uniref:YhfX family PLP-dependent enzyme n=1 Tax=uncultured Vibrio sp. TaxID=114054 RepID=UPI0025E6886A|nr:YhfX family PLP-dependent enzyme [uncultured Vibrio sp.]